jgi:hypothetical protein
VNTSKDETRGGLIDAALRYCDGRLQCDARELIEHELRTNAAVSPEITLRRLERDEFVSELEGLREGCAAASVRAQIAGAFRSPEEWAEIVDKEVQRIRAEHDRRYYRSFVPFCLSELEHATSEVLGPTFCELGYPDAAASAASFECRGRQAGVALYLATLFRRLNDLRSCVGCYSDIRPIIEAAYAPRLVTNDESLWRSWSLASLYASPPPVLQVRLLREDRVPALESSSAT